MNNSQDNFHLLLQRYFEKTASKEEKVVLFQMLQSAEHDRELSSFIAASWENYDLPADLSAIGDGREALLRILGDNNETEFVPVRRMRFWQTGWFRYAAAAILLLGMGAWLWVATRKNSPAVVKAGKQVENDVAPGKEGAILTLANGKQIVLDSLNNGIIATQSGSQVTLNNGLLSYDAAGQSSEEVVYNTVSTPNGRRFQLALPDGSRVWLNAASSIKYPAVFTGNERKVEIDGEAYFEVSPLLTSPGGGGKKVPFKVIITPRPDGVGGAEIEVLGTHFNVNAYNNETAIKTTLLEGKVRVVNGRELKDNRVQVVVLKPGEQAIAYCRRPDDGTCRLTIDRSPNLDQVVAWKNGLFNFEGLPLQDILNQLERWYNIEVVYQGPLKDMDFYGKIDRNANLSSIIKALNASGIHCRQENRKLIMLP